MTKKSQQKKRGTLEKVSPQKSASIKKAEARSSETWNLRRGAISIFILFHLVAITCWTMPLDGPPLRAVREFVLPYMLWTGLFQSWNTFAPDPKEENSYIKAVVMTQNHHMHVWAFPLMEQLSFGERYRKERYRKFTEVLPEQANAALWPDVAKHLAWQFNSPADPPDKVMLVQFQTAIKPGATEADTPSAKPHIFYENDLQSESLK